METEITDLLVAQREGDREAFGRLVPLVYPELRRIARAQLAGHRRGALLDTTALVHEAYLKLVDQTRVRAGDRAHFFALAARTMRQIVVNFARRRGTEKRGGGAVTIDLDRVQVPAREQPEVVLAIHGALERLERLSPRLATVFECRYFLGLSERETTEALGLPLRTVQRDSMKSRAWLRAELSAS